MSDFEETVRPARILPAIMVASFAGTSLWFAGNAILPDLQVRWGLPPEALGDMTSAVQLGFIAGTLLFAFLAIADRWSPRLIFLLCALAGAAANAGTVLLQGDIWPLLILRFVTGFFLAGIYPVGMKIASGWYREDLGKALGILVGALVVGTALPHLIRGMGSTVPWEMVMIATSVIAVLGGALMYASVPDGPYLQHGATFDPKALAVVFGSPRFRASAFGYFGHMWELYAFWAFVPVLIAAHAGSGGEPGSGLSLWAFAVIAAGAAGSVAGGAVSLRLGSAKVASSQLLASGICCLVSPLVFMAPTPLFLAFLLFWGVVVAGDSAQFSALNARYAPDKLVGSALTIANCIGFGITIASLQLVNTMIGALGAQYVFLLLVPGPVLGLISFLPLMREERLRSTSPRATS